MCILWSRNKTRHMNDQIVILSAQRAAIGGFGGELRPLTAAQLGSVAARATTLIVTRASVP